MPTVLLSPVSVSPLTDEIVMGPGIYCPTTAFHPLAGTPVVLVKLRVSEPAAADLTSAEFSLSRVFRRLASLTSVPL